MKRENLPVPLLGKKNRSHALFLEIVHQISLDDKHYYYFFFPDKFCHFFAQKNKEKITFHWIVLVLSKRMISFKWVFVTKFSLSTKTFEKILENFVFFVQNGFFKTVFFFHFVL